MKKIIFISSKTSFHFKLILCFIASNSILNFFLKIYDITLDRDPNWAKIQDPDPNSMYFDPQH